ncbi:Uncharacterized conserved protein, DUF302 family [Peptoclostridium litorale DSM 5388]|uniref:DUF302 domain-containing protein n=1 Tax=Peptoclostridium litorale DSM 5388 TaxID=1121324 RepID=A0A069RNP0_PEPLI|nr:DUF302 domain-containing protein [Peptoclostridium litorale]KDR95802.1 hypothetical protein CLIT_10c05300 [Peptoclostridium litorale DSM 5388]SIO21019.1 Uncharacterized conserved protein, DUF302 family [Peptoclostridium litorale DSM 5388]
MEMNYEVRTEKSFYEAIKSIKEHLEKCKFGVLWEVNFKDKLAEKGFEFGRDVQILEVCNPANAVEVLGKNIEVAYFLPCKVVVYEKDDSVYIGMVRPEKLIELLGDKSLQDIAMSIESDLKKAIQDASK